MSINIKNLTFVYSEGSAFEKKALDDVSLQIATGEFVGIIGHTGSGKSTLVQHLNVLLRPTSGEIYIDDENINADKSRLKQIRQKVGLVFQYPEHQLFEMTVFKDVAFGPENMGLDKIELTRRVEWALETVGLGREYFDKSPFDLSGGQKRRVAVAGVLAMKPEILILDEPAAGLDPRGRDEILGQIKQMHEKLKITVILVSHSMEDIGRLVDRIIVMDSGRLKYIGDKAEVFSHVRELESIGLAAPQVSYLMHSLREKGLDVPTDIFTVDAAADVLYQMCSRACGAKQVDK